MPDKRTPQIHELKCWPKYFAAIRSGEKSFEIRRNDRNFQVGDTLHLREWQPVLEEYTGDYYCASVAYITDFPEGLREGYICMGLR